MSSPQIPLQSIQLPNGDWLLRIDDGIEEMLVGPDDFAPEILARPRTTNHGDDKADVQ
jgi:hypothetical protein